MTRASDSLDVLPAQAFHFGNPLARWAAEPVLEPGIIGLLGVEGRVPDRSVHEASISREFVNA
jgi:hypothetical protein